MDIIFCANSHLTLHVTFLLSVAVINLFYRFKLEQIFVIRREAQE